MFSLFRSEALRIPKAALASRTITSGTPVPMSSVRSWWREVFSGTFFLMNPVLPAYFISAYAVALFCFMLVLCSTRGLPCPGRAWGQHKASVKPAQDSGGEQTINCIILLTLCSGYTGLCASLYARLYAVFMLFDYAKSCTYKQKLNTFDYASFMRVRPMRRMFQCLLYAGFMHIF